MQEIHPDPEQGSPAVSWKARVPGLELVSDGFLLNGTAGGGGLRRNCYLFSRSSLRITYERVFTRGAASHHFCVGKDC